MRTATIMSLVALLGMLPEARAEQPCTTCNQPACCGQCGCGLRPKKICRLKCEMKPVTTFDYSCKCEDFCVPGPSKCCGTRKVPDCNAWCGFRKEDIWQPRCGCVRKRTVLVKVPVTKQVPTYTCEVVCICGGCGCAQVDEAATAEARSREIMPVSAEEPLVLDAGELPNPAQAGGATTVAAGAAGSTFAGRIFGR